MDPYVHQVQYYETDAMRCTHHSNYIRFMEEARLDYLRRLGWGYEKMEADGLVSPVVSLSCQYRKPTVFGDRIEIEVEVRSLTGTRLTFAYTMRVGDEIVCTGESCHCFLDESGNPVLVRRRYPAFSDAILRLLSPGESGKETDGGK